MSRQQSRHRLRRRYLSLGAGELAAAGAFLLVSVGVVAPWFGDGVRSLALWCAVIPLLAVLVQAGLYWLFARSWVVIGAMPSHIAAVYRILRVGDAAILGAGLIGIILWSPHDVGLTVLLAAIWVFAVIEYLNYFVVRLSYPVGRWLTLVKRWRAPQLVRDMQASGD